MKLMKTELERLKNRGQSTEKSDEEKRLDQIESMYDTIMTKYGKVRGILARKNQTISTVAREIDDVPTRTELIQYERRFQELYQEIESTLEETRKYFDKYNIQVRIKSYLQKEVEVLGKSIKSSKVEISVFWIQPSLIIVVIIVTILLYSSFLLYHIFKTNPKQVYTNILILSLLCFLLHLLNACSLI